MGTPSAQSENGFINALFFSLKNSGLNGSISYVETHRFPKDRIAGASLPIYHPLKWSEFEKRKFDPNFVFEKFP